MIPVCDMKPQYHQLEDELTSTFQRVMEGGVYMLGQEVRLFEEECAAYLGFPHAVGVASGTDAIELAIRALGLGPGDEVIVPANSYPSIWGVIASGVTPVVCDINPDSLCFDEQKLVKHVSNNTKAVLVVHLYGFNMLTDSLMKLARQKNLFVIEDCAQSFGAKKNGTAVGLTGDIATFSFYPTKPLGGYGDGGMVMTKEKNIQEKLQRLRMYGESARYQSIEIGTNSRLDELQAAMLRVKLPRVQTWIDDRKTQARYYRDHLKKTDHIRVFESDWWEEGAHHLFVIRTMQRDALRAYLDQKHIGTAIHYPLTIPNIPSLKNQIKQRSPQADVVAQELLSLPLYNGLSQSMQKTVVQAMAEFSV